MAKDKKYYDDFFTKYPVNVHDDPVRFIKIASLCRGAVGDFGCGTGTLADYFHEDYFGCDISVVAVESAKLHRRNTAMFEQGDLLDPNYEIPQKFDTIILAEFLEHIEDDIPLFQKIHGSLKPNGRIIISVPNDDRVPDESHFRTFTVPELRKRFSPIGKVKFHNYPGFAKRILMTIDVGQKNDNLISLVMPVKNEALGLENAILSCLDFVDNVVVSVDDASDDKTLEIARRYADVVKSYKWENSFAKARNFAQEGVNTKWVLALDGHEFVELPPNLEKHLSEDVDGLEINIVLENGFKFHFPRIIKSSIKWEADVHNYPAIKSRKFYNNFIIRHDRDNLQAPDAREIRDKQRSKMVREIMIREQKKDPKAPRPYFYLAQQNFHERNFKESIKFYNKYLKVSKHKGERWLANYDIAAARVFLNQNLRALWALSRADKEIPGRWEVALLRGSVWAIIGNHERAVGHYVDSFSQQTGNFTYCPAKRDDAETWNLIGRSLYALKKISEAKIAWERAVELEKEKPDKEQNSQRLKILATMLKY